jgi:hypothetical protein
VHGGIRAVQRAERTGGVAGRGGFDAKNLGIAAGGGGLAEEIAGEVQCFSDDARQPHRRSSLFEK